MPTIRQLSQSVINKIAAGEVIERPASVVKELLENAVDAGASRIEVHVDKGGTERIRISDDGCGIDPDQLLLAVASHATSKIQSADDLFSVDSLGFRGEALASIAEISRFRIRSRTADNAAGAELEVAGGQVGQVMPCACSVGTTLEVADLFFNTPVRRKFMKAVQTELAHIVEAFCRVALPYPQIGFTLYHNERPVHELMPVTDWRERIVTLFGPELGDGLIWIDSQDRGVRLSGYVADPVHSRGHNKMQYLFLNGRHIRDRQLQHALGEAYRGLLLHGRHPIAFLRLEMAPDLVDVNVHPCKLEVRFQEGGQLYSQMLGTLRGRFLASDLTARVHSPHAGTEAPHAGGRPRGVELETELAGQPSSAVAYAPAGRSLGSTPAGTIGEPPAGISAEADPNSAADAIPTRQQPLNWRPETETLPAWPRRSAWGSEGGVPSFRPFGPAQTPSAGLPPIAGLPPAAGMPPAGGGVVGGEDVEPANGGAPGDEEAGVTSESSGGAQPSEPADVFRRVVALQAHNRYLITETAAGLEVIDQHALHERILYEEIREKILQGGLERQRLLVPEPVQLTPTEAAAVLDQQALLASLGMEVQDFGGGTVVISSYPAMLARVRPGDLLRQVATQLVADGKAPDRRDVLDHLLHTMACKGAVKAGDRLADEEIQALLARRHGVQDSHHCPHGRPTTLVFTREELDRRFQRI